MSLVNKVIHFHLLSLPVQSLVMSGWWEEPVTVLVYWRWNTRETGDHWMVNLTGTLSHRLWCADSWTVALMFQHKELSALQFNLSGGLQLTALDTSLHWGSAEHRCLIILLSDWRWSVQVTQTMMTLCLSVCLLFFQCLLDYLTYSMETDNVYFI